VDPANPEESKASSCLRCSEMHLSDGLTRNSTPQQRELNLPAKGPAMATSPLSSLRRQRDLLLASLLVLTAAAWALLIWQATHTDAMMAMSPTMGTGAALWLAIWVAMMVAIMFPTAAPMILMFAQVYAAKRQHQQPFVPTWVFVSAYLLVWTLMGVLAYAAAVGAEHLAAQSMWVTDNAGRLGGIVLLAAGLYQLSALKRVCLANCRSPLAFIMASWRPGYGGAFRMGLEHGAFCLGCCWLLFVILFPLGMLNIAALAALSLVIFAEKSLPLGHRIAQLSALVLIAYGLVAVFAPQVLPTMQGHARTGM
jgi:predicted metal-binding membrane protein